MLRNFVLIFVLLFSSPLYSQNVLSSKLLNSDSATIFSPFVSYDGFSLLFSSNKSGKWILYESKNVSNNWEMAYEIESINIQFSNKNDELAYPSLSADNQFLFFSVRNISKSENYDIYYCARDNTGWGKCHKLNTTNSSLNDIAAVLAPTGDKLIFGRYNSDKNCTKFYTTKRLGDSTWAAPILMPKIVNNGCENSIRWHPSGQFFMVSSKRNENNIWNLYAFEMISDFVYPTKTFISDTVSLLFPMFGKQFGWQTLLGADKHQNSLYFTENNPYQINYTTLIAKVLDDDNNPLSDFELRIEDAKGNVLYNNSYYTHNGHFSIPILAENSLRIKITKQGFTAFEKTIKNDKIIDLGELVLNRYFELTCNLIDNELFNPVNAKVLVADLQNLEIKADILNLSSGLFRIKLLPGKAYKIKFENPAYETNIIEIDISGSMFYSNSFLTVTLQPKKVNYTLKLIDAEFNEGVSADLILRNTQREETIVLKGESYVGGNYSFKIRPDDTYAIWLKNLRGYYMAGLKINETKNIYHSEIKLLPLKTNSQIVPSNISFEESGENFTGNSVQDLNRIALLMKENPTIKIEIQVFVSPKKNEAIDVKLAHYRAKTILDYLISQDIGNERIMMKGVRNSSGGDNIIFRITGT